MKTRIQKWGNSLAVRIPKSFAEDVGFHSESEVELSLVDGHLVIAPVTEPAQEYELEDLLAQIDAHNLHDELDFGQPMGDEQW